MESDDEKRVRNKKFRNERDGLGGVMTKNKKEWINHQAMNEEKVLSHAIEYVEKVFADDFSGHDIFHTMRVYRMASKLAKEEGADLFIVRLAALLHDVDDEKLSPKTYESKERAVLFMTQEQLSDSIKKRICEIVSEISFGSGKGKAPSTLEGMCVQDADRLDALGAIGIARAFAYGGSRGRELYNPKVPPRENMTRIEYREGHSTTINHFYEKLFKLKSLMNTQAAKLVAEQREQFMREYLATFLAEWNAE